MSETKDFNAHYKKCSIEPVKYIRANNLDFFEGNIIKYITRHKDKGGAEDIKKVIHYAEMILEDVYGYKNGKPSIGGVLSDTGEPFSKKPIVIKDEKTILSELKQKGLTDREAENITNKK